MNIGDLPPEARRVLSQVSEADAEVARLRAAFDSHAKQSVGRVRQLQEQAMSERAFVEALVNNRVRGIGLLADLWADYEQAYAATLASELRRKTRPAPKAAAAVRARGVKLAAMRRRAVLAEWTTTMYEWHFPWLKDLRDDEAEHGYLDSLDGYGTFIDLDELDDPAFIESLEKLPAEKGPDDDEATEHVDPVQRLLSQEEWTAMPTAERNQLALDRYLRSRKTPWQLGRDYERYIGFLREQAGWKVAYHGIFAGLEDLGRDLIAEREGVVDVIQCKRWAQVKTIHERHVFQLFGTVTAFRIERPLVEVVGTFVTTTSLSDRARAFAAQLGVVVEEQVSLDDYPRVKCNVSRIGEKIYHLPFDQQYDTTVIESGRGEFYAATCIEAETQGFRRAWRWSAAE